MKTNPFISIIVPIYNVEKYLAECLNSCINQTLKEIEIICVNDCSTDNSFDILNSFAKKDERIKVVQHEKNKGLGAARNTGLTHALGEYIWFVDSDDFIDINACQILYKTAKENKTDILCFNAISFIDEDKKRTYFADEYYTDWQKNNNIDCTKLTPSIHGYFTVSACMYISERVFISNFKFRENCYYEDTDFTPILFSSCNSLRCISFTAYHRRITPGSIMQSSLSEKKLLDKIAVCNSLHTYIKQKKLSKKNFVCIFYYGYSQYVAKEIKENLNIYKNISFTKFIKEVSKQKRNHRLYLLITIPFRLLRKILLYV